MRKTLVDVDIILKLIGDRSIINDLPLDEIAFCFDGKIIEIPKAEIEEFQFTGLSNIDFISMRDWTEEPIEIKKELLDNTGPILCRSGCGNPKGSTCKNWGYDMHRSDNEDAYRIVKACESPCHGHTYGHVVKIFPTHEREDCNTHLDNLRREKHDT